MFDHRNIPRTRIKMKIYMAIFYGVINWTFDGFTTTDQSSKGNSLARNHRLTCSLPKIQNIAHISPEQKIIAFVTIAYFKCEWFAFWNIVFFLLLNFENSSVSFSTEEKSCTAIFNWNENFSMDDVCGYVVSVARKRKKTPRSLASTALHSFCAMAMAIQQMK